MLWITIFFLQAKLLEASQITQNWMQAAAAAAAAAAANGGPGPAPHQQPQGSNPGALNGHSANSLNPSPLPAPHGK